MLNLILCLAILFHILAVRARYWGDSVSGYTGHASLALITPSSAQVVDNDSA